MIDALLNLSPAIRYVAVYADGGLQTRSRDGNAGASSDETDRYEELLVNPTLLKLTTQRGNIDCGGMRYVLIRYGNFFQFVKPTTSGHVSVAIEADADVMTVIEQILSKVAE